MVLCIKHGSRNLFPKGHFPRKLIPCINNKIHWVRDKIQELGSWGEANSPHGRLYQGLLPLVKLVALCLNLILNQPGLVLLPLQVT